MWKQGQLAQAIKHLRYAIELSPHLTMNYCHLAYVLMEKGEISDALTVCEHVLHLNAQSKDAHLIQAMCYLSNGDWLNGFAEYELAKKRYYNPGNLNRPLWTGASLAEQSILLLTEQGLGDTIQFIRYASVVAERNCPRG